MTRAVSVGCALACASLGLAAPSRAPALAAVPSEPTAFVLEQSFGDGQGETLALPLIREDGEPKLVLAQRTIDRQWISRNDPDHVQPIPGWRSEPAAVALSAAFPGAGQLYAGERSGYMFALAEAVGWVTLVVLKNDADGLRDDAKGVAGTPNDPASGWSFDRWATATGEDPQAIEALYEADRDAFYATIARDSRYRAGWTDTAALNRYVDLRDRSDHKLRQSRGAGTLLWLNHLVGAADALRAARIHNLPLRENLNLKATGGWQHHRPSLRLALVGRF